jgi:hypothetical protein
VKRNFWITVNGNWVLGSDLLLPVHFRFVVHERYASSRSNLWALCVLAFNRYAYATVVPFFVGCRGAAMHAGAQPCRGAQGASAFQDKTRKTIAAHAACTYWYLYKRYQNIELFMPVYHALGLMDERKSIDLYSIIYLKNLVGCSSMKYIKAKVILLHSYISYSCIVFWTSTRISWSGSRSNLMIFTKLRWYWD